VRILAINTVFHDPAAAHADRPRSGLSLITVSRVLDATQHLLRDSA
jgi:hypothetical protein